MNTPIMNVVPQPGATFPYSEFNGRKIEPTFVTIAGCFDLVSAIIE
jgi:hypothetical protein